MIPDNLQTKVALGCYAIVSSMFATFHNAKYRGSNFKWDNFPEMMESKCKTDIFLNTNIPEKHIQAAKEHAGKTGKQIAQRLIDVMRE